MRLLFLLTFPKGIVTFYYIMVLVFFFFLFESKSINWFLCCTLSHFLWHSLKNRYIDLSVGVSFFSCLTWIFFSSCLKTGIFHWNRLMVLICVFKKCWLTIFLQYFFKVFISFYAHSSVNSNFCSYIKNYIVCTKSLTKLLSSSENMNASSEVS